MNVYRVWMESETFDHGWEVETSSSKSAIYEWLREADKPSEYDDACGEINIVNVSIIDPVNPADPNDTRASIREGTHEIWKTRSSQLEHSSYRIRREGADEGQALTRTFALPVEAVEWLATNYRDDSSGMMFQVFTRLFIKSNASKHVLYPWSTGEFKRCINLLDKVPAFRARLHELRKLSPKWNKLVDRWSELEAACNADHQNKTQNTSILLDEILERHPVVKLR